MIYMIYKYIRQYNIYVIYIHAPIQIRSVQMSCADPNYIATASLDGYVRVFDVRKIKGPSSCVNEWLHGKGVN